MQTSCLFTSIRLFSSRHHKSFYDTLGVTKKSTTKEIKAAYFKLSKLYHPDVNQSVEAADKFREINAAYEVLKHYRAEYDRDGVNYERPPMKPHRDPVVVRPMRPAPSTGRTDHFDYGTWERMHYGDQFQRRMRAKARHNEEVRRQGDAITTRKIDKIIFIIVGLFCLLVICIEWDMSSKDEPSKPVISSDDDV